MIKATPQPTVVVAALTYKRPEMLKQLLESLLTLEHPAGWDVRFLIVDNDADASARSIIESFAWQFGTHRLDYAVEPEPGIPFARNRALDEVTAQGARLLAFIDDDEYPDPHWLSALVGHHLTTGAVLTGGPVRFLQPPYPMSPWDRFLLRSIVGRLAYNDRLFERRARKGRLVPIATNNWLADVAWLESRGVRFDPNLRVSGSSDIALCLQVRSLEGKLGWCSDAVVYEHVPRERLSLRYQCKRFRSYGLNTSNLFRGSRWRESVRQAGRMIAGFSLMVVPVFGAASFMLGANMLFLGSGWFRGLRGARSSFYSRSDG